MINILDLAVAAFILFYLLKNAGGILKTAKNLAIAAAGLMVFGLLAELLLSWPVSGPIQPTLKDSYFVKLSHVIIKIVYPAVENNAPKVDTFIKEKIMTAPTPEVTTPKITIPHEIIPKAKLEDLLEIK